MLLCPAVDFLTVQKEVYDLLKGRILVGHALRNDLQVSGAREWSEHACRALIVSRYGTSSVTSPLVLSAFVEERF